MSFQFRIQNFQSIADQTIDVSGFTTIVGPSNLGKSAIIRSLRAWAYNELHPSYIRDTNNPKKECVLTGIWPEGNAVNVREVEFRKSAKDNVYTITFMDGSQKSYPKIGSDTPDELKQLGFLLLETEREDLFNLSFQSQLDNLFLVTEQPTTLTSFLNKIFDIAKYERALRGINSDITIQQRQYDELSLKTLHKRNELEEQLEAQKLNAEKLAELSAFVQGVKAHEAQLEHLQRGAAEIQEYQAGQARLATMRQQVAQLQAFLAALQELVQRSQRFAALTLQQAKLRRLLEQQAQTATALTLHTQARQLAQQLHTTLHRFQRQTLLVTQAAEATTAHRTTTALLQRATTGRSYADRLREAATKLAQLSHRTAALTTLTSQATQAQQHATLVQRGKTVSTELVTRLQRLQQVTTAQSQGHQLAAVQQRNQRDHIQLQDLQTELTAYAAFVKPLISICPVCQNPLANHAH